MLDRRVLGVALGIVAAMIAGCSAGWNALGRATASNTGPFIRYEHRVPTASIEGRFDRDPYGVITGVKDVIPVGDCVFAVGSYYSINEVFGPIYDGPTGPGGHPRERYDYHDVVARAFANWTGESECTRLVLSPPEAHPPGDVWRGDGLSAVSAVATDDGAIFGADPNGLARRDPDGSVHRLDDPPFATFALARANGRLFGAGFGVWSSDDDGATVRAVTLGNNTTLVGGRGHYTGAVPVALTSIVVEGDTVVAAGSSVNSFAAGLVWFSGDSGKTWRRTELLATSVGSVIKVGERWLVLGGDRARSVERIARNVPFILSSTDGARWDAVDSSAMGEGVIVDATLDSSGSLVLLGQVEALDPATAGHAGSCGVVWTGSLGSLRRQDLGCSDQPLTSVVTLSDGRVMIAGNTDLWIRG